MQGKDLAVSFKRNLDHNYMVIKGNEESNKQIENNYRFRMLIENKIENILSLETKMCDGIYDCYFEISGKQPVSRMFEHHDIRYDDLIKLISEIEITYNRALEYMLEPDHFILEPQYMYINVETRELGLVYYPVYEKGIEEAFIHLAEYILDRVDHQDSKAVMLAYQIYKKVREKSFTMKDLINIVESSKSEKDSFQNESNYITGSKNVNDGNFASIEMGMELIKNAENISGIKIQDRIGYDDSGHDSSYEKNCEKHYEKHYDKKHFSDEDIFDDIQQKVPKKKSLISSLFSIRNKTQAVHHISTSDKEENSLIHKENHSIKEENSLTHKDNHFIKEENQLIHKENYPIKKENQFINNETDYGKAEIQIDENMYGKTIMMISDKSSTDHFLIQKIKGKEIIHKLSKFPMSIGKVPDLVDIVLKDGTVSKIHAEILEENGTIYLKDCNSTNGTFVNGMQLDAEERISLESGDELSFGKIKMEYQ